MRALRIVGIVFACLIALVIIALIAVRLTVNPNDYKGRIEAAVKSSTGRELSLPGQIKLSVLPWIGVSFGPASLGNPPGFGPQPFASVQYASVHVRLLPLLFHKEIQVGRVVIDGLDLDLRKDAEGRGNWQMTSAGTSAGAPSSATPSGKSATTLGAVAGVTVRGSRLSYQGAVVDHINLDIGRVAPGVPIRIRWSLDLLTSPGVKPIPISGSSALMYSGNAARLSALEMRVDGSTLHGSAAVTNLATDATTFDLAVDQIDLDQYLPSKPSAPTAKAASESVQLPTGMLQTLQTNGRLSIGSATVLGLKLTQVQVGVAADGGVVRIAPTAAKLYGGALSGNVTVNARGSTPVLTLDESMSGIDIQPLLEDYAKLNRLSGRGNVTVNLTMSGHTNDELMRTLDGHVTADLANGAISGVDLWSDINQAVALAERRGAAAANGAGAETKFSAFKASADLTNGIATTKDLDIASGDLRVTGQGTTNLLTDAVDYRLSATILKGAAAGSPATGTLASVPLLVSGTLTSPTVRPDVQNLAKSFAQRQLQQHKQALQQKLKSTLKGLFR